MLSPKSYINQADPEAHVRTNSIFDDPVLGLGPYKLISSSQQLTRKVKSFTKRKQKAASKIKTSEVLGLLLKTNTKNIIEANHIKETIHMESTILPLPVVHEAAKSTDDWDLFMDEFMSDEPVIIADESVEKIVATETMPTIYSYTGNDSMTKYIVGGDMVNMSLEQEVDFADNADGNICYLCNSELIAARNMMICSGCGVESANHINTPEGGYSTSALNDCNVHKDGFLAFKVTGRGSYGCQRSMLKTCASYTKYRKNTTLKDMKNWNIHSKKHHIPKNVIKEANDMFATIKEHGYVFRKDGKKGVLSACLYYACYNNGISKTPSEIAQFSDIEEKFHSFGDRMLHDLNERGVIEIPDKIAPITDYVNRYMTLLNIPTKYTVFVLDLIARAEHKKIHIVHDSKNNTKCVGAIYMLVDRVPDLRKKITKELIESLCCISKTTFIRYYNVLCTYHKKLKKVFRRHGISMKTEWR
jgi:transcription initiation factor TFIIIB Brf1 subunit/transcription initiation factor TFIIB